MSCKNWDSQADCPDGAPVLRADILVEDISETDRVAVRVVIRVCVSFARQIPSDAQERLDCLVAVATVEAADELGAPVICLLQGVQVRLEGPNLERKRVF